MSRRQLSLLCVALFVGVLTFATDLMTPYGFVGGVLGYFISILLAAWLPWRGTAYWLAGLASLLTVVGGYALPGSGQPVMIVFNRILLIAAYWAMAYLVDHRRATESRLAEANHALAAQARQEQRETAKRLRSIADNLPALVAYVDTEVRYRFVNARFHDLHGLRPKEVVGRSVEEVRGPVAYERIGPPLEKALGGHQVSYEAEVSTQGGIREMSVSYVPVRHDDGQVAGVVVLSQDVTERREQERQLRFLQRMDTMGQLTGGVAHDFNNLLNVIIGNLELLDERLADDAKSTELIAEAIMASQRGGELTRQLLAFARRQPLDAKPVDFNDCISETMDLLRRTLGARIVIETALDPALWPALADPGQVEAALTNLALNARDAMPNGGRLTIRTGNRHLDAAAARERLEAQPGEYAMLAVSDTGGGMTPEVSSRVFEPFFTTKPPGAGSGLGLSMVYGFVKQSQGHISISTAPGRGTDIRLYLPRARAGIAPAFKSTPAEPPRATGKERVLLVEDNAGVRRVVARQMLSLGYQVLQATNSEEALEILGSDERIDLLFTDVVMPGGMTGDQLAHVARQQHPRLKVLLTSGDPMTSAEERAQSPYLRNLLNKPFRSAELATRLRQAIDGDG